MASAQLFKVEGSKKHASMVVDQQVLDALISFLKQAQQDNSKRMELNLEESKLRIEESKLRIEGLRQELKRKEKSADLEVEFRINEERRNKEKHEREMKELDAHTRKFAQ